MKRVFILILSSFLYLGASAQSAYLQWARQEGGRKIDNGNSIDIDASGTIYVCGDAFDTSDLDPSPAAFQVISKGANDAFVQKLDASGNLQWLRSFGSTGAQVANAVRADASGNVYVMGTFDSTVDFNPGSGTANLTSAGSSDVFIVKLDANGNYLWAKRVGGTDVDLGRAMALDASGNVYVTGAFRDTVDFDPGAGTHKIVTMGGWDIFVLKLDASGNFGWAKQMGSPNFDIGYAITLDASGNVYSTGYFTGTVDFNPNPSINYNLTSAGMNDVYVQKLDASGNFVWAVQFGGPMSDFGYGIVTDASGNVYTTGNFSASMDADPGTGIHTLTASGMADIYIQKLDAFGNFVWAKQVGGSTTDGANAIAIDLSNDIYVSGAFSGTVDFDPNAGAYALTSVGVGDGFVQKLDGAGNLLWAHRFGGKGVDEGTSLKVSAVKNVYITGGFTDTAFFTFNTGTHALISSGGKDIFIEKVMQCTLDSGTVTKATACGSYTWTDGVTYTQSDTIAHYVPRTGICDSVYFLDLTILPLPDRTVSLSGYTLTSNATGVSYQWVKCGSGYTLINGATSQSYTATVTGGYAVIVTDNINNCKDTSDCITVTVTGVDETSFEKAVRLYPDPTTGLATLDLTESYADVAVQVLSVTGQVLQREQLKQMSKVQIDLRARPAGVYFIRVNANGRTAALRLLKE